MSRILTSPDSSQLFSNLPGLSFDPKLGEDYNKRSGELLLKIGSKSPAVAWIQYRLNSWLEATGRKPEKFETGTYDQQTASLVERFQRSQREAESLKSGKPSRFKVDKVVGQQTLQALESDSNPKPVVTRTIHPPSNKSFASIANSLPGCPHAASIDPAAFQKVMETYTRDKQKPAVGAEAFLKICSEKNLDPSLALAVAIWESNIGTSGGLPGRTKNMCNVGNEPGTGMPKKMETWEKGVEIFAHLMVTKYGKTAEEVIARDFRRVDGRGQYAEAPRYTLRIANTVARIRQALNSPPLGDD